MALTEMVLTRLRPVLDETTFGGSEGERQHRGCGTTSLDIQRNRQGQHPVRG